MQLFRIMLTMFLVVVISYRELLGQLPTQTSHQPVSRDLFSCKVTSDWKRGIHFSDFHENTLSQTGDQLLINDSFGKGLFLVDVQALNKEPQKLSEEWYLVWFDSESDFVFGLRHRKPYPNDRVKRLLNPDLEMCCFKNTKDLMSNLPMWTSSAIGPVRWLESSKRFVRVNSSGIAKPSTVDIFDEKGGNLKSFSASGPVLGVDEDDSGIQIIYYAGKGRNTVVHAASLTRVLEEKKKVKLGNFPNAHVLQSFGSQTDMRRLPACTRFIRTRGLRKGDVLGYFTDICANPRFLQFSDYASLAHNPLNQLNRRTSPSRGVWTPINQRAAAEDSEMFEFFSSDSIYEVCFLVNHQGTIIPYDCAYIHDAVRIENRWLFVRVRDGFRDGTPTRELVLTQVEMPEDSSYSK